MTNIVFIVIDTLSAFHLPMYGYDRETAPFLEQLSDDGRLFTYAYANAPWTVPSHASMFSGLLPTDHGATTKEQRFTSKSFISELDHTTIGISNNSLVCEELGYAEGFGKFHSGSNTIYLRSRPYRTTSFQKVIETEEQGDYDSKKEKYIDFAKQLAYNRDPGSALEAFRYLLSDTNDGELVNDSGAAATNTLALKELESVDEPFFLFINYMEPHERLDPPPPIAKNWIEDYSSTYQTYIENVVKQDIDKDFWNQIDDATAHQIRGLYDAEIKYLDQKIEQLHEQITAQHEDTVFIITSDHGENLGYFDMWGHQYGIWEPLIRVPLLVTGSGVPAEEVNTPFELRQLESLVKDPDCFQNPFQHTIFAEYHGSMHIYDSEQLDYTSLPSERLALLMNESRCVIEGNKGVISNSHLKDMAFQSHPAGFNKDGPQEAWETLKDTIENRFDTEIAGIDL